MKKTFWFLLTVLILAGFVLAGCGGSQPATAPSSPAGGQSASDLLNKGGQIKGMAFDYKETVNNQLMFSGKYALDGNKFRAENTMDGQKSVLIFNGNTIYMYNPDQNVAYKITSPDNSQKVNTPLDYDKNFAKNLNELKFLEDTNLNGTACKLYSLAIPGAGTEKIWFSAEYGIPVRVENTGPDGTKTVIEYDNLQVGPQPAQDFQVPAGAQITDFGKLMQQPAPTPGTQQ